jgi:hypothetical protein
MTPISVETVRPRFTNFEEAARLQLKLYRVPALDKILSFMDIERCRARLGTRG